MSGATISASTAALISALVGTAGVGAGIFGTVEGANEQSANRAAQAAQLTQEQQAQANQANLSKQEAVLGATGQAQAQTGGSLTDPGTTSLTDLLAGYPGFQSGTNGTSVTGTPSGAGTGAGTGSSGGATATGGGSASPDIATILAALRGQNGGAGGTGSSPTSSIFGGNWQTQPAAPSTQFELANPLV